MKGKIVTGLIAGALLVSAWLTYDYKIEQLQKRHSEEIKERDSKIIDFKINLSKSENLKVELEKEVAHLKNINGGLEKEVEDLEKSLSTQQRIITEQKEEINNLKK